MQPSEYEHEITDEDEKAAIWALLDEFYKPVEKFQTGDITVEAWRAHYGGGDKSARAKMIERGKLPGWQTLHVANPSGAGRLLVLRKIDTLAEKC